MGLNLFSNPRHGSPLGADSETDALVDELLPGYRKSAA
jgi:hypothetical protein